MVLNNLQQSHDINMYFAQKQRSAEELQQHDAKKTRRHLRLLLAALACTGAVLVALPGGWQQLVEAPPVSWLLGGLALTLLWPRDN